MVLDILHSDRFRDQSPAAVYETLLDEGIYHASISTFYRILLREGEARERRSQATHPPRVKPELLAQRPREVWSWDCVRYKVSARKPARVTAHLRADEATVAAEPLSNGL